MSRRVIIIAFLGCLFVPIANAQEKAAATDNPFKFTFGMKEKGGFGASVKGDENKLLGGTKSSAWFVVTGLDVHWDSAADSPDQAVASVKPGLVFWGPNATFFYDVAITLDVAQRAGQFKTATGAVDSVNQTLGGITVIWIPRFFTRLVERDLPVIPETAPVQSCRFLQTPCTPEELKKEAADLKEFSSNKELKIEPPASVTLTYYKSINESSAVALLPTGIESDKIILRTSGDIALGASHKWRLLFDGSLTKPTTGDDRDLQKKIDVAVGMRMKQFTPVIRYVNGKEGGFKYDRQVLLGLLWQFAGLS